MKILEPTLIIGSASISPNNGGATTEIDFDFGNLEGAWLLQVDYFVQAIQITGEVSFGLNFDPNAAVPAASTTLHTSSMVFAAGKQEEGFTTSGYSIDQGHVYPLRDLDIYLARNIALQGFEVSANNRVVIAKIYYKRIQFTESEIGGVIAFRR